MQNKKFSLNNFFRYNELCSLPTAYNVGFILLCMKMLFKIAKPSRGYKY